MELIQEIGSFQLQPLRHRAGVQMFLDFFRLRPPVGAGRQLPDRRFLLEILERFAALPYENISKIIRLHDNWDGLEKLRLPEQVIADHAAQRLGGTCFSLTFFLQAILAQHEFACYPVMADMRAGANIHCALVVMLDDKKYLLDPGYLLNQPMELNPQNPRLYRTEFAGVELRFEPAAHSYHLFTFNKDEMKWRYRFADRPTPPAEFLRHWLASFERNSMNGIYLSKATRSGLIYVHNTFMRETTFAGKRNLNIKKNFHAAINETFGIAPQIIEQAQWALAENLARKKSRVFENNPYRS